jgi:predicted nucleic acid-binding protein
VILVDTSVWIELLHGRRAKRVLPEDLLWFVTCGPIIQEVLQGLRAGPEVDEFRAAFLAIPRLSDPLPVKVFLDAAEIYRRGRQKGYTIRSSTDCLIAAIAIENRTPIWHRDRDFSLIASYTSLELVHTRAGDPGTR